jgi:hypothetical protein
MSPPLKSVAGSFMMDMVARLPRWPLLGDRGVLGAGRCGGRSPL